ncbi:MAG: PHP domain-containing protein [Candidatus Niameybacter stercoravium]|nr:PHP domain-containing protein [Candidatus Niameybacter stercoravium]
MKVDMHMHTYFSDGTMSPEEIVQKAKTREVGILAITDHNKLESWEGLQKAAAKEGIIPIRGVEINAAYKDKVLHLLAYGFEDHNKLFELIDLADREMQRMSDDLIVNLSKIDERVSLEDFNAYEYDRRKGGWKGLHYLLDRGLTTKLFEGFRFYREYGCDFPEYHFPTMEELCKDIKEAGGYSVLAHPMSYFKELNEKELIAVLEDLRSKGLTGIECYYPTHSEMMTKTCVDFCKKYNMLITTGSDEHGEFGKEAKTLDQTIGCMNIHRDMINIEPLLK